MICKTCQVVIPEGMRFCPKCGADVRQAFEAEQAALAAAEAARDAQETAGVARAAKEAVEAEQAEQAAQEAAKAAQAEQTTQAKQTAEPAQAASEAPAVLEPVAAQPPAQTAKPAPAMQEAPAPEAPVQKKRARKRPGKTLWFLLGGAAVLIVLIVAVSAMLAHNGDTLRYNAAALLAEQGNYREAQNIFQGLGTFDDAWDMGLACYEKWKPNDDLRAYNEGVAELRAGNYEAARTNFESAEGILDASARIAQCEALLAEADGSGSGSAGNAAADAAQEAAAAAGPDESAATPAEAAAPQEEKEKKKDADGMELPVPAAGESLYIGTMQYDEAELSKMAFVLSADGSSIHSVTIFNKNLSLNIAAASTKITGMTVTEKFMASYDKADFDKLTLGKSTLLDLVIDGDTATATLDYTYTHRDFGGNAKTYEVPFGKAEVTFTRTGANGSGQLS